MSVPTNTQFYAQQDALEAYRLALTRAGFSNPPDFHVVLGSGFGASLTSNQGQWRQTGELQFAEIPGLPASKVQDHAGKFRFFKNAANGLKVVFQSGRIHGYEGHSPKTSVLPVILSRFNGTKNFLLTNAAGGLDRNALPGDVMLIRDHVNMTGNNPLVGENPISLNGHELGPRFPDLSQVYDPEWRRTLRTHLQNSGSRVHEGTYMGLLGPCFETPAEVELYGKWGIHAVGMSTVWEAIALKHSGARVGGLSLISNAACGLGDGTPLDHETILETCRTSARNIVSGILTWLETKPQDQTREL